jgi:hypothetical protein
LLKVNLKLQKVVKEKEQLLYLKMLNQEDLV